MTNVHRLSKLQFIITNTTTIIYCRCETNANSIVKRFDDFENETGDSVTSLHPLAGRKVSRPM
jgi:hypothetical protein